MTLKDERGNVLGTIETPPDEPDVSGQLFPVRDAAGREMAAPARDPHAFRGSSIIGDLVFYFVSEANWEAELLRHHGFRRSNSYTVLCSTAPTPRNVCACSS